MTPEPFRTACAIFFREARRLLGGIWGRMQDVFGQFVGDGLVPRYVMKANWVEGTLQHGVLHGSAIISIIFIISINTNGMR